MTEDYEIVKFEDVAKKINVTVDRETTNLEKYVAGDHMNTDDLHIKEWGVIGDDYLGPAFNKMFKAGQILYGSRRTYLRKVAIPHFDGICANTTFVIEPTGKDLLPELVPFVMHSQAFTDHSIKESKGSTNPYVNWKDIAKYEFPVPVDMERQKEISEILHETECLRLKNLNLMSIAEQYLSLMMQNLFQNGIKHVIFKDDKKFGQIPKEWEIKTIDQIKSPKRHAISMGPFGSDITVDNFVPSGVPVIRGMNLTSHVLVESDFVYLKEEKADALIGANATRDDIIITHRGTIGQVSIIPKNSRFLRYVISQSQMKLSCNENITYSQYVNYFLNSPKGQYILLRGKSHTGVPAIAQPVTYLKHVKMPIPSLIEQEKITTILTKISEIINSALLNLESTKALKFRLINEYFPGKEEVQT